MLHVADSSLPASLHPDDEVIDFLGEAIALAQRINRQLGGRSSLTTSEAPPLSTTPVEN